MLLYSDQEKQAEFRERFRSYAPLGFKAENPYAVLDKVIRSHLYHVYNNDTYIAILAILERSKVLNGVSSEHHHNCTSKNDTETV